jgi:hypothetical protein
VSARVGAGLDEWFDLITRTKQGAETAMEIDYKVYGEGEALLGWLNATIEISSSAEFDANAFLAESAEILQRELQEIKAEVAHLKMTLSPDDAFSDVAVINLVRNDGRPESSQELPDPIERGELILNIRAEADPQALRILVDQAIKRIGAKRPRISLKLEHIESFRPGQPRPTHRVTSLAGEDLE